MTDARIPTRICPDCDGTGGDDEDDAFYACADCDGFGRIPTKPLTARQVAVLPDLHYAIVLRCDGEEINWAWRSPDHLATEVALGTVRVWLAENADG